MPSASYRAPRRGASVRGRRDHPGRRRSQHAAAPPALGGRPGGGARGARHRGRGRPAGCRRQPAGPPGGLHPVPLAPAGLDAAGATRLWRRPWIGAQVAVPAHGPGRDEPLRGRWVRPLRRRRRLPEPDVPLPAALDPLRRHRRGRGHRYQVHVGPMYADTRGSVSSRRRIRRSPGARSTTCPPSTTGANGSRRCGSPGASSSQPAMEDSTVAGTRPGRRCEGRGDPRLGGPRRGDRAAPVVYGADGRGRVVVLDPVTMRVHGLDGLVVVTPR